MKIEKKLLLVIAIILSMSLTSLKEVKAETRNIYDIGSTMKQYPSNNTQTFKLNQWSTLPSNQSGYSITFNLDTNGQDHFEAGQYLFDFYIETNNLTNHLASCNGITTDFQLYDLTSSSWISSANQSKSQCLDSYYTTIGGNRTIHYLFSWTTNNGSVYDILFTRMRFIINNYTGQGFIVYDGSYMVIMGTVQDYDPQVVQNFTNVAEQQRLNQQSILNATQNAQNIINNQNQNTQDILNSQATINQNINAIGQDTTTIINQQQQNAQQAHQDSQAIKDAMTDSSTPNASQVENVLNLTHRDNAKISDIVNFIPRYLQTFINNFSVSCPSVGYSLGSLFGTQLTIPCINPQEYLGSFLWGTIDAILCLCYLIPLCKFLVNKYNDLTSLKNLRWQ